MNGVERFDDSVWDRFFDFLYGEGPSAQEAQERLRALGIDVTPAVRKVQDALQASRARARFEAAREQLRDLMTRRFTGTALAAYVRKLEQAASDQDLRALLDDLRRLERSSEEGP
jgi:hypothetical protein